MADLPDKNALADLRKLSGTAEVKPEEGITPVTDNPSEEKPSQELPAPAEYISKLSDEDLLKVIESRGMKVSKETLSDEQKAKAAEIEKAEKIKFGIENNLITHQEYVEAESIIASDGIDLTKKEFAKVYKADNKNATQEEINDAYDDYYHVAKTIKNKITDDDSGEEKEIEVPKWDDKFVKWGENRINSEAERIREGAKSKLENLDSAYKNLQTIKTRSNDYEKAIGQVVSETNFAEYPTSHKVKGKEISAVVKFDKPNEVKSAVEKFLTETVAPLFLQSDKYGDVAEIKRQVHGFLKENYSSEFDSNLWELGKTQGLNEGKVGVNVPPTRVLAHDDTVLTELEKSVEDRLPKNPLLSNQSKR